MMILTTSKHLIQLIEDLAKDLKKDQDLSSINKISMLEGATGLATCLMNFANDETLETVEEFNRIKAEFNLYLTIIED